jgi:hypothetical protein
MPEAHRDANGQNFDRAQKFDDAQYFDHAGISVLEMSMMDDISDDELTRLALEADPDLVVPDDAPSLWELLGVTAGTLLPSWYMPPPEGRPHHGRRWKRMLALVAIVAFLAINASGLCSTNGWIELA